MTTFLRPIAALGARLASFLEFLGGLGYLLLDTALALPRGLMGLVPARMSRS